MAATIIAGHAVGLIRFGGPGSSRPCHDASRRFIGRHVIGVDGGVDTAAELLGRARLYLLIEQACNAETLAFAEVLHESHHSHDATDVDPMDGDFLPTNCLPGHTRFSLERREERQPKFRRVLPGVTRTLHVSHDERANPLTHANQILGGAAEEGMVETEETQ
jgi:hypothetical protein